jgi:hypothetical protein
VKSQWTARLRAAVKGTRHAGVEPVKEVSQDCEGRARGRSLDRGRVRVVFGLAATGLIALAPLALVGPGTALGAETTVYEPPAVNGYRGAISPGGAVTLAKITVQVHEGAEASISGTLISGPADVLPMVGWECEYSRNLNGVPITGTFQHGFSYIGSGGSRQFSMSSGGLWLPAMTWGGTCSLRVYPGQWSLNLSTTYEKYRIEGSNATEGPSNSGSPTEVPSSSDATFNPLPYGPSSPPPCIQWAPWDAIGGCPTPPVGVLLGTATITYPGTSQVDILSTDAAGTVMIAQGQEVLVILGGLPGGSPSRLTVDSGPPNGWSDLPAAFEWGIGATNGGVSWQGSYMYSDIGCFNAVWGNCPAGGKRYPALPWGEAEAYWGVGGGAWGTLQAGHLWVHCRVSATSGSPCLPATGAVTAYFYAAGPAPMPSSSGYASGSPTIYPSTLPTSNLPVVTYPPVPTGTPRPTGSAGWCNPFSGASADAWCVATVKPPAPGQGSCVAPLSGEVKPGIGCLSPMQTCSGITDVLCGLGNVVTAIGNGAGYTVNALLDGFIPGAGTGKAIGDLQGQLGGIGGGGQGGSIVGQLGSMGGGDVGLVMHFPAPLSYDLDVGAALSDALDVLAPWRGLFGAFVLFSGCVSLLFWTPRQFGLGGEA